MTIRQGCSARSFLAARPAADKDANGPSVLSLFAGTISGHLTVEGNLEHPRQSNLTAGQLQIAQQDRRTTLEVVPPAKGEASPSDQWIHDEAQRRVVGPGCTFTYRHERAQP